MYHYIDDKDFVKRMHRCCSDIVNQLVQKINNDTVLTVKAHLVGSGAKNLITQNAKEPIDLDYNLCIMSFNTIDENNCREIKEYIRKKFNVVLKDNGWHDCEDSTSSLTTGQRHFTKGNQTHFSIDIAIVKESQNSWHRLIHEKTGISYFDKYFWNEAPHSNSLSEKVTKLKINNLWQDVRNVYIDKKNMYLQRNDTDHPSFIVYIEAVNEVYNKEFPLKKQYNVYSSNFIRRSEFFSVNSIFL